MKGSKLSEPAPSAMMKKRYAEKTAPDLKSPEITVKNRFCVLEDTDPSDLPMILPSQTVGLG